MADEDVRLRALGNGSKDKLKATIEAQTQDYVLKEAQRLNRVAAADPKAPTAEVLTEVFDTPDQVWPATKVRDVVTSLRRDYLRLLAPYLDHATRTFKPGAPTDDELREQLKASTKTYATLARPNQHKNWFEFFTDRTRDKKQLEDALALIIVHGRVERGEIREEEALAQLSQHRAGVMAKARALEHLDELKKEGKTLSKHELRATRAQIAAAERAHEPRRHRGGGGAGRAVLTPEVLARLQARAAAAGGTTASTAAATTRGNQ